jgi:hypothetical protein
MALIDISSNLEKNLKENLIDFTDKIAIGVKDCLSRRMISFGLCPPNNDESYFKHGV